VTSETLEQTVKDEAGNIRADALAWDVPSMAISPVLLWTYRLAL
jgi:hypothetical protein